MNSSKIHHSYHLADESPWPFLVSTVTASLFLTLGAVLFFYFFFETNEFSYCIVSFMSLASKIKFIKTGNANYRYYRPYEFYKLPHNNIKFDSTPVYKFLVDQVSKRDCLSESESSITSIIELLHDENNN